MTRIFREYVDRHHRYVYGLARYILDDPAEAEDLTQEVFERLWQRMESVDEKGIRAWLAQVTRNACIDRLRARKTHCEFDEAHGDHGSHDTPLVDLASARLSDWLRDAIQRLQEPHRSIIVLIDLQQRSVRDTAQQLSLSENQVKVYTHRARKTLRTLLQDKSL